MNRHTRRARARQRKLEVGTQINVQFFTDLATGKRYWASDLELPDVVMHGPFETIEDADRDAHLTLLGLQCEIADVMLQ